MLRFATQLIGQSVSTSLQFIIHVADMKYDKNQRNIERLIDMP